MRTGIISGGIGDIVYTIPVCRLLRVTRMYIKLGLYADGSSMYSVCKPLLESQGIECLPTAYIDEPNPFDKFEPGIQYDINFDAWRIRPGRDRVHIIKNMMLHYRCYKPNWNTPYLFNIGARNLVYKNLIFLTWRWRAGSPVRWPEVLRKYDLNPDNTAFIGLPEDYDLFKLTVNSYEFTHLITPDLLTMAEAINGSDRLFCNQGVALTIAQGLGKNYWLERKPEKTNTLFFTPNEHLL